MKACDGNVSFNFPSSRPTTRLRAFPLLMSSNGTAGAFRASPQLSWTCKDPNFHGPARTTVPRFALARRFIVVAVKSQERSQPVVKKPHRQYRIDSTFPSTFSARTNDDDHQHPTNHPTQKKK
jgi:hypothetical protein